MLVTTTSARPPATIAARVLGDSSDHLFFRFLPGIEGNGTDADAPADRAGPAKAGPAP